MYINDSAYKLFRFLEEITGCDIEKKLEIPSGKRSGTIGKLITEDELFNVYKEISACNNDIAYIKGMTLLKQILEAFRIQSFKPEDLQECGNVFLKSSHFISEYNLWYEQDKQEFIKELFSIPLIREDEKIKDNASKITRLTKAKCQEIVTNSRFINIYQYRKGTSLKNKEFEISNTFLIASDITNVLNSIKPKDDDKIHYYLVCKIEEQIDYTYFIIVIQYKDSVWLATDSLEFDNPRMKNTTHSVAHRRKDHWDNVYMPYSVIDDIERWRKESGTLIDPTSNVEERYIKELSSYLDFQYKCCLWFLISAITDKLIDEQSSLIQIGFANEYAQKLLEATEHEFDTTFSQCNYEACQKYQDDFIYPNETSIVHATKTDLIRKYIDKNWLSSPENFTNLVAWSEKEELRSQKQQILSDYYNSHDECGKMISFRDPEHLKELIAKNITRLEEFLFSGNKVFIHIVDEIFNYHFGADRDSAFIPQITTHLSKDSNYWPVFSLYKGKFSNSMCYHCGKHHTSITLRFDAHHYAELLLMTGLTDRKELPRLFWNYKAFQFIPYCGNSILDNVNPEFLVKDPLSDRYANHFAMSIHYYKICHRKLLEKYRKYDETVYVIDKTGKILDICDYKTYILQFKSIKNISI